MSIIDSLSVPYPPDTRAKGWRFELDHERIEQSDTWTLAPAELRPWLLMLWMTAWKQTPCGSLNDDDTLIAARIGMSPRMFAKHREVLMRGWWKAADGRLYHETITQRVREMLAKRAKDAKRAADNRARKAGAAASHGEVTGVSRVTPAGLGGEFDTKHQAPEKKNSDADASDAAAASAAGKGKTKGPKTPEEMAKAELWKAAVSVLEHGGCPASQCRTFMGKLVGDYTFAIVKDAVAAAVSAQPADAREYLKATCMRLKGERVDPATVPSDAAEKTQAYLAERFTLTPEEKAKADEAAKQVRQRFLRKEAA